MTQLTLAQNIHIMFSLSIELLCNETSYRAFCLFTYNNKRHGLHSLVSGFLK